MLFNFYTAFRYLSISFYLTGVIPAFAHVNFSIKTDISQDKDHAKTCLIQEGDISSDPLLENCTDVKVKKFWQGKDQTKCSYYTENLIFVAEAPQQECGKEHVLKNPKSSKNEVVSYFTGMENLSLPEIFSREEKNSFSFRQALMDEKEDSVDASLSDACRMAIKEVYQDGRDFSLDLIKKYTMPINEIPYRSGRNDLIFYHYTDATPVKDIALANKYIDLFTFIRNRKSQNWWRKLFYVAEDPKSSTEYGRIQVKMFMKPTTSVLNEFASGNPGAFREQVLAEIRKNYPDTRNCMPKESRNDPNIEAGFYNLYYLAAEDSGVDMIQYRNFFQTNINTHRGDDYSYFQVLNPAAVDKIELGTYGAW